MRPSAAALIGLMALIPQISPGNPLDYTQWRGTDREGSASGFVAPAAWPDGLTRRWRVDVGEGYSTPLLFLLEDSGDLIVARAARAAFEPLKTYTVSTSATWAQPAISGNRIFMKDASSVALWTVR